MRRVSAKRHFSHTFLPTGFSILFLILTTGSAQSRTDVGATTSPANSKTQLESGLNSELPGSKCISCHESIVRSYRKTAMGLASGAALDALIPGEIANASSGVHYRVFQENGKAWLEYYRDNAEALHGKQELIYFIGSGHRGRTYLFSQDEFVFESPVNWYGHTQTWDMTPAYKTAQRMPLNLPAEVSCLHCHTSGFRPPKPGTENLYEKPLFAGVGISCERCHGESGVHASGGPALNLSKLPSARQDAICMQCHLEGSAAIEQPGKHLYDFKPGDDLADYEHYLVLTNEHGANPRAVSQFEALAQSGCKKKAGDALRCTSCHDPHSSPTATERYAYYAAKCLACHAEGKSIKHVQKNRDCISCHMPTLSSSDVAHTQATDHRILRQPRTPVLSSSEPPNTKPRLEGFPPQTPLSERDIALGWLALEQAGRDFAYAEADLTIPAAAKQYLDDPAIQSAYAYRELTHKRTAHARELYEKVLKLDPLNIDAAVNLGVIEAQSGSPEKALGLWKDAFLRAPWRSVIGYNLAQLECSVGDSRGAQESLRTVLRFNPDYPEARRLLQGIDNHSLNCGHF